MERECGQEKEIKKKNAFINDTVQTPNDVGATGVCK